MRNSTKDRRMEVKGMKMGMSPALSTYYGNVCANIAASGQFILGNWTKTMELNASEDLGGEAIAYSCATDATTAVLRAINCKVLIMPALAFSSSILAAENAGVHDLRFVDCDENGIKVDELLWALDHTKGTKPVFLLSHFGGGMYPNSLAVCDIMDSYGGLVVEDFSHSWGAYQLPSDETKTRRAGTFGDISIASLFATKPVHCGVGAIIIDRFGITDTLRMMREYGRDNLHGTSILMHRGGSWRLSEMEAALFCITHAKAPEERSNRIKLLRKYCDELPGMINAFDHGIVPNGYRAFYRTLYPEILTKFLKEKGISLVGKVYDDIVTASPIFAKYHEILPFAEKWCKTTICLPLYADLKEEEQGYVIECVREFEQLSRQ